MEKKEVKEDFLKKIMLFFFGYIIRNYKKNILPPNLLFFLIINFVKNLVIKKMMIKYFGTFLLSIFLPKI
jgi:hypothetical protein